MNMDKQGELRHWQESLKLLKKALPHASGYEYDSVVREILYARRQIYQIQSGLSLSTTHTLH